MQNVRERNHNIMRLRGILPQVATLIPPDIRIGMSKDEYLRFQTTAKHIMNLLDETAERNARTRIKKTKSLTKQARRDLLTIYNKWDMTEEEFSDAYKKITK